MLYLADRLFQLSMEYRPVNLGALDNERCWSNVTPSYNHGVGCLHGVAYAVSDKVVAGNHKPGDALTQAGLATAAGNGDPHWVAVNAFINQLSTGIEHHLNPGRALVYTNDPNTNPNYDFAHRDSTPATMNDLPNDIGLVNIRHFERFRYIPQTIGSSMISEFMFGSHWFMCGWSPFTSTCDVQSFDLQTPIAPGAAPPPTNMDQIHPAVRLAKNTVCNIVTDRADSSHFDQNSWDNAVNHLKLLLGSSLTTGGLSGTVAKPLLFAFSMFDMMLLIFRMHGGATSLPSRANPVVNRLISLNHPIVTKQPKIEFLSYFIGLCVWIHICTFWINSIAVTGTICAILTVCQLMAIIIQFFKCSR